MYLIAGMVVCLLFSGCFNSLLAVYCYVCAWLHFDGCFICWAISSLSGPPLLTVVASIEEVLAYIAMAIPSLLYVSLSFP